MTETDFWIKYWRAEYLHSTKNIVAAAAEAAEDEELAVFLKKDDILASEARRKVLLFFEIASSYILIIAFSAKDYKNVVVNTITSHCNKCPLAPIFKMLTIL